MTMEAAGIRSAIAQSLPARVPQADAIAHYYGVEYDLKRARLFARMDGGRLRAWAAVCQTGMDLFRPLVVVRAEDPAALPELLGGALAPGRQYLFSAPLALRDELGAVADLNGERACKIYTLAPAGLRPVVNILVQTSRTPDGKLRASVRARDGSAAAEAGTSWISSQYAEIFVQVTEAARGRGLGKSVVSAVSAQVLEMGRMPLYITAADNAASQRLAESLGYLDSGARELNGALSLKR